MFFFHIPLCAPPSPFIQLLDLLGGGYEIDDIMVPHRHEGSGSGLLFVVYFFWRPLVISLNPDDVKVSIITMSLHCQSTNVPLIIITANNNTNKVQQTL